jgi:hypothetical protein
MRTAAILWTVLGRPFWACSTGRPAWRKKIATALGVAHKLSLELRTAEDRIKDLEADVQFYQVRADRAEKWLHQISVEIEQRFLARPMAGRPSERLDKPARKPTQGRPSRRAGPDHFPTHYT